MTVGRFTTIVTGALQAAVCVVVASVTACVLVTTSASVVALLVVAVATPDWPSWAHPDPVSTAARIPCSEVTPALTPEMERVANVRHWASVPPDLRVDWTNWSKRRIKKYVNKCTMAYRGR